MKTLTFLSKLENIAKGMDYYAVSVPLKITQALKTKGPVPVVGCINGSKTFIASLYPVGGGRHGLRIKNEIRKSVGLKAGDRVKVQITVRDREKEVSIPKDLMSELRSEGVVDAFKAVPVGQRSFLLRKIEQAAKPETRKKRIQEAVEAAHKRKEKR